VGPRHPPPARHVPDGAWLARGRCLARRPMLRTDLIGHDAAARPTALLRRFAMGRAFPATSGAGRAARAVGHHPARGPAERKRRLPVEYRGPLVFLLHATEERRR